MTPMPMKKFVRRIQWASLLVLCGANVASAQWGSLKGRFLLDGKAPEAAVINADKDTPTCGKCALKQETLVVNSENNGIRDIVITLSPAKGKKKDVKIHPDYEKDAAANVTVANQCCRFDPHVVLLRTSQTLVITNPDPVAHNSNVTTIKNAAINPSIPAGGKHDAKFPKEENLPCKISCNIHPWMSGQIVIKDHPYMAATDADGNFEIKNLPVGEWQFRAWQESSGYIAKAKIGAKESSKRGEFDAAIKDGETTDLGVIKVGEAIFKKKK
ncbi:MAG: hypothetical protein O2931_05145 [Planctomycetota bacterium]|nr:hypothetical protein [Planctomycetota bacterium]MDA1178168.1 hypothetical protein [Planctomycetota bacterium]